MCELLCYCFRGRRGCGHVYAYHLQRCHISFSRPDQSFCDAPNGRTRDLPRRVYAADDNKPGPCPACRGDTPPSSEGSEIGFVA
ncbi:hypothetical protein NUU61_007441 [Penicillium alfredii]|uniref:Uncharacterized protein n=1 Tax=Penicillium alfredii TaxID=1506179 RepID=A0A9W9F2V9_9EURO|nr:uncharacterized protein NUU61_007441 [Penicillium alfredii]KAJ5092571.1 hypothetical protein NUU61_007441 [Penicillium alfredii]